MLRDYLPLLLHIGVAIGSACPALLVSVLLGKTGRRTRVKDTAYECGIAGRLSSCNRLRFALRTMPHS